jgi:hypothetical protein
MTAIEVAEAQARKAALGDAMSNLSSLMQSENRKMFEFGKRAAMAETIVSTYVSAQNAFKSFSGLGPWGVAAGAAAAAAAIAAGYVRLQKIRSTQFGSSSASGGGGGGASKSGGGFTPATPGSASAATSQSRGLIVVNVDPDALLTGRQLVDIINETSSDGVRVGA